MIKTFTKRITTSFSDNPKEATRTAIEKLKMAGLVALVLAFNFGGMANTAQPASKIYRIGFLLGPVADADQPRAILARLRALGYVERQDFVTEQSDKAAELVQRKVDVVVAFGTPTTLAAKKSSSTIPIVMVGGSNPIQNGLIASLARPGGNVTGITSISGELGGKRLEVLKNAVPRLSRVIISYSARSDTVDDFFKETEPASRALTLQLIRFAVRGVEDYEEIFRVAKREQANGLYFRVPQARTPAAQRKHFTDLAVKNRLPAMYEVATFVEDGGLMSYGSDLNERYQRAAVMIDKILKGANPADIPVEQPMRFEFVVNLKAAKQINLTIPPEVLARATRIIR